MSVSCCCCLSTRSPVRNTSPCHSPVRNTSQYSQCWYLDNPGWLPPVQMWLLLPSLCWDTLSSGSFYKDFNWSSHSARVGLKSLCLGADAAQPSSVATQDRLTSRGADSLSNSGICAPLQTLQTPKITRRLPRPCLDGSNRSLFAQYHKCMFFTQGPLLRIFLKLGKTHSRGVFESLIAVVTMVTRVGYCSPDHGRDNTRWWLGKQATPAWGRYGWHHTQQHP